MFYGYATDHEHATIYVFASEYRTREATRENVERCVNEQTNHGANIDSRNVVVHTALAAEGMAERVEELARDLVTGCDGVDAGYRVCPVEIAVRPRATAAELAEAEERERETQLLKMELMSAEEQFFALAELGEACKDTATQFKATSLNLWFEGDTARIADDLKALGCRWSEKRKGYYWRIPKTAA